MRLNNSDAVKSLIAQMQVPDGEAEPVTDPMWDILKQLTRIADSLEVISLKDAP
jgi:hypothetical protein